MLLFGALIAWLCSTLMFQSFNEVPFINLNIQETTGFANTFIMVVIIFYTTTFWFTTPMVSYVYAAEILTDKGMSISSATHWAANSIISVLPSLGFNLLRISNQQAQFNDATTLFFFFFSGISIAGFFIIMIYVKETLGKSRKEIAEEFTKDEFSSLAKTNKNES